MGLAVISGIMRGGIKRLDSLQPLEPANNNKNCPVINILNHDLIAQRRLHCLDFSAFVNLVEGGVRIEINKLRLSN